MVFLRRSKRISEKKLKCGYCFETFSNKKLYNDHTKLFKKCDLEMIQITTITKKEQKEVLKILKCFLNEQKGMLEYFNKSEILYRYNKCCYETCDQNKLMQHQQNELFNLLSI